MAVTYTPRSNTYGASFGGRIFGTFSNLFGALAAWNDARATRSQLSRLTDRELDDIGLRRSDIKNL
ncbi:DUF1127 domain-containing protein [Falsihalocynthiibacter sp. SS001]|uniref:DUF1127 domain-containing protein n=1 Tax=Falsihalocynthiibacter sp. SS001 TaxID=3349698 RepID=UPI0036D3C4E2